MALLDFEKCDFVNTLLSFKKAVQFVTVTCRMILVGGVGHVVSSLARLRNEVSFSQGFEEVEEAVVGGLIIEKAQFAAFAHIGQDFNGAT